MWPPPAGSAVARRFTREGRVARAIGFRAEVEAVLALELVSEFPEPVLAIRRIVGHRSLRGVRATRQLRNDPIDVSEPKASNEDYRRFCCFLRRGSSGRTPAPQKIAR